MRKERRERKSSEKGRNKRERKCRRKKERREGVKVRKRRWRQSKQKEEGGGLQPLPASCTARPSSPCPRRTCPCYGHGQSGHLRNGAAGPEPAECPGSAQRPGTEGRVALASARQSSPTRAPTSIMASPRVGFSRRDACAGAVSRARFWSSCGDVTERLCGGGGCALC